ncbi:hypothetical protein KIPB_010728, partial [Kipferlia bialata]
NDVPPGMGQIDMPQTQGERQGDRQQPQGQFPPTEGGMEAQQQQYMRHGGALDLSALRRHSALPGQLFSSNSTSTLFSETERPEW